MSTITPTAPAQPRQLLWIKPETKFYGHQIEGIRKLARWNSWLLGDDMGLGKSLQSLAVCAIDFQLGHAKRVLIVAPASIKWNWLEDIEKFTTFKAEVLDGGPAKRDAQLSRFKSDILIVNYEQVISNLDALNRLGFDIVIGDEAHTIKSPRAKRTIAFHKLVAKRFFLLSGSFLLNRPDELWSPLHRIDPQGFPKYYAFVARYCMYGGYKSKQIIGVKNPTELSNRLNAHMLRRKKMDVLDLPEKQHIPMKVSLTPEQAKMYKQARDEMQIDMPDNPDPMQIENALVKFLRLKQICGTTACITPDVDSSIKLDRVIEMTNEKLDQGEAVIVFTQFRGVIAAAEARFRAEGIPLWVLHGNVPMKKRHAVAQKWKDSVAAGKPGVLLCMLQVAGVGLNLTAARTGFMIDKLFVPKLNEQAEDRMHRIGASTTQPVQIYEFIALGTIEARIEAILSKKRVLFDTLVDQTELKRALYAELKNDHDL